MGALGERGAAVESRAMSDHRPTTAPAGAMRPVGGPAELVEDGTVAASGHLVVDGEAITFQPRGGAQNPGRRAVVVPLAGVTGVSRRDGIQRVVIESGSGALAFRGVGAQRAWLALKAMRDGADGATSPRPLVFDEEDVQGDATSPRAKGLYAIGGSGFGYVAWPTGGRQSGYWDRLDSLRGVDFRASGVVVRAAGDRAVTGACARAFVEALVDRWLDAMPTFADEPGWRVRAARVTGEAIEPGTLSLEPTGLTFEPVEGAAEVVVPRGALALAQPDGADPRAFELHADDGARRFRVIGARSTAETLAEVFASDAWHTGTHGPPRVTLSDPQVAWLYGPCTSAALYARRDVIARAGRLLLRPTASQVELLMSARRTAPPSVPFPCELRVSGSRGRFAVDGVVSRFQALQEDEQGNAWFNVVVRFRGEVRAINEREHFRLALDAPLRRVELTGGNRRLVLVDYVRFVDLAKRGCRIAVPACPDVGSVCVIDTDLKKKPTSLSARVVHVTATKEGLWLVGVRYEAESAERGGSLFMERRSEQLRGRHG